MLCRIFAYCTGVEYILNDEKISDNKNAWSDRYTKKLLIAYLLSDSLSFLFSAMGCQNLTSAFSRISYAAC